MEILHNDKISIKEGDQTDLTNENVINKIRKHEKHSKFFSKRYEEEIEFISSNLSEIMKPQEEQLMLLKLETIEKIINNENLTIDNEDDLLRFINKLYLSDSKYSSLYELIYFENVTKSMMKEFISMFNVNDINPEIWNQLCKRLEMENVGPKKRARKHRGMKFELNDNDIFHGIIDYLRSQTKNIDDEIQVIASSCSNSDEPHQPRTILLNENPKGYFATNGIQNSWVTLDFKEHRIIPTHYAIRSSYYGLNSYHLKGWVIEVSNDNNKWTEIDEVNDCQYLNGSRLFHTFKITKEQTNEYRYFRIRQPGKSWGNSDQLVFESIEIYGTLI